MFNLSDFSPEVIQNYLFRYLSPVDRGHLEQTNKYFLHLSRDYLARELKRDFDIEPAMLSKFYSIDLQETIRVVTIYLYRCASVLEKSDLQSIIQVFIDKNDGFLEETLIICQQIKIKLLKKKLNEKVASFFEKIEQLLGPPLADCFWLLGGILMTVSPAIAVVCTIIFIPTMFIAAPAPFAGLGTMTLIFIVLSLPLLLYASSWYILEKLKLASEFKELKRLKRSLQSKRAIAFQTPQENSFKENEETTSSVTKSGPLTPIYSAFFKHNDEFFNTNDFQLPYELYQAFQFAPAF